MTLDAALAEIRRFWPGGQPFAPGRGRAAARLAAEFGAGLPAELVYYFDEVAPAAGVEFEAVGNPLVLYGLDQLGPRQPGYSFNPLTHQPIPDWPPTFCLLADQGADPLVVDLAAPAEGLQLLRHGAGRWQAGETVAATPGQLLLCAAARHHALTAFESEPIIDDEQGFNLAPRAAWLLPRLRQWAGAYYDAWAGVFANA